MTNFKWENVGRGSHAEQEDMIALDFHRRWARLRRIGSDNRSPIGFARCLSYMPAWALRFPRSTSVDESIAGEMNVKAGQQGVL